jgi:hypothetical protein
MLEFFRKHVVSSLFGAVGVVLAALGYADQAGTIITRFQPWQLQALGAALFIVFVVLVLASYHKQQGTRPMSDVGTIGSKPTEERRELATSQYSSDLSDPNTLPEAVVAEYKELMCSDPTQLQLRKMMKPYEGKWMILEMQLRDLIERDDNIAAMMGFEDQSWFSDSVWVYFGKQWFDHLHGIARGAKVRFKARIVVRDSGDPYFVDAIPTF